MVHYSDEEYTEQLDYGARSSDYNSNSRSSPPESSGSYNRGRQISPGGDSFRPHDSYSNGRYSNDTREMRYDDRSRGYDRGGYRRTSPPSPRLRGRSSGYIDRDREGYRSPSRDRYDRTRSRSRDRRRRPPFGQESREVMLEGAPADMNEDDISRELKDAYHVGKFDDIRVIRDRRTKASRQLCFITFPSIDDSRTFLEANFPHIYLYGPSASDADERGTKVRIAYSREREDRQRSKVEGEWLCSNCDIINYASRTKCFRCQASRAEYSAPPPKAAPKPHNVGDSDVAPDGVPSQFLLFRGLDSSVTEELLAKGVAKLYKPSAGADAQGGNSKKGAKVVSTTGNSNLGAREGSVRRVLLVRDRKSNDSWGYGFAEFATVDDAQAALNRHKSFETFTISSKPVLVSYIHAGVFVPVLNPTASTDRFTFSPLANPSMKLSYWDQDAYVTELAVSEEPGTGPVTTDKVKTKAAEKPKKRKTTDGISASAPKKIAMSSHLQFWSNRHAELHGIQRTATSEDESVVAGSPEAPVVPSKSYADATRMCCYLCMRQFKTMADVNRHERLSDLHRKNLQNPDLIARAEHKLSKQRDTNPQPSMEYRDRAKERRQVFGSMKPTKAPKPGPPKSRSPEPAPQPTMSKGASLLGKMGWSAGTGLGAQGTGTTALVPQELYVQGVGLGAQGGKVKDAVQEAERRTRGKYDDFLEKTKEQAKQRYEQMMKEES